MAHMARAAFRHDEIPGMGTRAMGMAGAFTAIADDSSGIFWNPAGSVFLDRAEASLGMGSLSRNAQTALSLQGILPKIHGAAVGVGWSFLNGKDDFLGSDHVVMATLAMPLDPSGILAAGIGLKYLRGSSRLGSPLGSVSGRGLDMGLLMKFPLPQKRQLSAAFVIRDLSTALRWSEGLEEKLPAWFTLGVSGKINPDSLLAIDYSFADSVAAGVLEKKTLRFGGEYWFLANTLAVRMGFVFSPSRDNQFTMGMGYRHSQWRLDYGFLAGGAGLGFSHRLDVSYQLAILPFQSGRSKSGEIEVSRIRQLETQIKELEAKLDILARLTESSGRKNRSERVRARTPKPARAVSGQTPKSSESTASRKIAKPISSSKRKTEKTALFVAPKPIQERPKPTIVPPSIKRQVPTPKPVVASARKPTPVPSPEPAARERTSIVENFPSSRDKAALSKGIEVLNEKVGAIEESMASIDQKGFSVLVEEEVADIRILLGEVQAHLELGNIDAAESKLKLISNILDDTQKKIEGILEQPVRW